MISDNLSSKALFLTESVVKSDIINKIKSDILKLKKDKVFVFEHADLKGKYGTLTNIKISTDVYVFVNKQNILEVQISGIDEDYLYDNGPIYTSNKKKFANKHEALNEFGKTEDELYKVIDSWCDSCIDKTLQKIMSIDSIKTLKAKPTISTMPDPGDLGMFGSKVIIIDIKNE